MANKHRELSATANVAMNMFRAVHIPEKNVTRIFCVILQGLELIQGTG